MSRMSKRLERAKVTASGSRPRATRRSRDGTVALWAPPKLTTPVHVSRLSGRITQVAWGADGPGQVLRWAAADANGRVMIGQL
jgi:hypothetical protein